MRLNFKPLNTFSFSHYGAITFLVLGAIAPCSVNASAPTSCSLAAASVAVQASALLISTQHATQNTPRAFIREAIGICTVFPPNRPACAIPSAKLTNTNTNLYDGFARSSVIHAFRATIPAIAHIVVTPLNGPPRPMNGQDFLAIDVLARTIFAEMRGSDCLHKPYQEAVARTILNRAFDSNARKFQAENVNGNPVTKVILRDQQYSVWNNDDEVVSHAEAKRPHSCGHMPDDLENHLKNTRFALCPGAPDATDEMKSAWYKSVDIAMNAVINEKQFMNQTASFGDIKYYRSDRKPSDKWSGYARVSPPRLGGALLNDWKCMTFWKDVR